MKKKLFSILTGVSLFMSTLTSTAFVYATDGLTTDPTIQKDLTSLKELYKDDFLIGNIVSGKEFEGSKFELLMMHHNVVTAENAMKPAYAYSKYPVFDFTAEDALVSQVENANLKLVGHVLVWHQQSEEALYTDKDGNPLDRDAALANLRTHVKTVVEHFGDKVIAWDVVNEAMNDNPSNPSDWRGSLRESGWLKAIGPDYVKEAFLAAKEALGDKDVKLYYNDYNDDNQNKAEAIYQMVKEINEEYAATHNGKRLINGIGMQAHYNLHTKPENVEASLKKFISVTDEISITELDITAGDSHLLSEKQATDQAYLYARLFKLYKEYSDHIVRVTFWGLNDRDSWRAERCPLLFDANLQAKKAYYAILDPDKFIEEYIPDAKVVKEGIALYGTPKIDGVIDDIWANVPELQVNQYQTAWQGASGVAKVLWDNENLYVLITVTDTQLDKSNNNPWEQDSVEIFLDQNNRKTPSFETDDGQYRVNFDNETSFNPASIATGFESKTRIDGTNYIVEAKIPFTAVTPSNDLKIGFDLQVNDGKNGARQSTATWNDTTGTGYADTSVYGVLTLKKP
jgi:endo-1,4-beta-xylanase